MIEDNNKQEIKSGKNRAKQVVEFFKDGLKKSFSLDNDSIIVSKRIKERSFDLYNNFIDVFMIFFNAIAIIFYYFLGMFISLKDVPHGISRAAHNNFRLGLENLKKNDLIDARIRFLLSNMFYSKSATTKYYIAYVYYLQENYKKSLKYLRQSLAIDSSDERSLELLKLLENKIMKKNIDI